MAEEVTLSSLSKFLNARHKASRGITELMYPSQDQVQEALELLPMVISMEGAFRIYITPALIPLSTKERMVHFKTSLPQSQCSTGAKDIASAFTAAVLTLWNRTLTKLMECPKGTNLHNLSQDLSKTPPPDLTFISMETGQTYTAGQVTPGSPIIHSPQGIPAAHLRPSSNYVATWTMLLHTKQQAAILQLALLLNDTPPLSHTKEFATPSPPPTLTQPSRGTWSSTSASTSPGSTPPWAWRNQ